VPSARARGAAQTPCLTLRHFRRASSIRPWRWIATRSGGHFATLYTHIDDLVESLRVVTPKGVSRARRLPGSARAESRSPHHRLRGDSRDHHGSLDALQDGRVSGRAARSVSRPLHRGTGTARDRSSRTLSANCRILDPEEASNTGAGDGTSAIMVLAFESADHPVDVWMRRAPNAVPTMRGTRDPERRGLSPRGAAGRWRTAFIRMPYARERTIKSAIINDTFETAITGSASRRSMTGSRRRPKRDHGCDGTPSQVTCRFTHVYPDGAAPYFTFHALGHHGRSSSNGRRSRVPPSTRLSRRRHVTHHHAVGRHHRPWYDRQRPLYSPQRSGGEAGGRPSGAAQSGVLIDP